MLNHLTAKERAAKLAVGQAEAQLEHALKNLSHIAALSRPIPKRNISRDTIHAQAEQAKLRAAFALFGF